MNNNEIFSFQVLKPVIQKFRSVILEDNFKKNYHDEMIRSEIMEIIHIFLGEY